MTNDPIKQMEEMESRYRIEVPDPKQQGLSKTPEKNGVPDPSPVDPSNVQPGQQSSPGPNETPFEEHDHNGLNSKPVSIRNLKDFIEVLVQTTGPSHKAKNAWDQIKIVNNAGTRELWVYDYLTADWHKI